MSDLQASSGGSPRGTMRRRLPAIIESTLREGEQFFGADFTTAQKLRIARLLDDFGVEYLELTSPMASPRSREDCAAIAAFGLNARTLTHTRCNLGDARMAVETGVDGVHIVIGASPQLRRASHGFSVDEIIGRAGEVIPFLVEAGVEVRFSTEDSMRTAIGDLLRIYERAVDLGVHRIGVADTVGVGRPREIHALVGRLASTLDVDVEFHGHNDTGCAIANAFCAWEAGATHIDTSVLGIGERNGITSLGGWIARMTVEDRDQVRERYRLDLLAGLEREVAGLLGVEVPFNACVTGSSAFSHKAGIHTKAVLADPSAYECLDPADFGLNRSILTAHRLTGWNAVRARATELGIELDETRARRVAAEVKRLADVQRVDALQLDGLIMSAVQTVEVVR